MIISASRRTDIPSYYSDWMFNRLRDGYVLVRNPMNIHQVSRISLSPQVVDGIVFWTKNPTPMLTRLNDLQNYNYYFQFTLTPYGTDVETNLPSKNNVIIPTFQKLSKQIGKERVIWRYDPIFFNELYDFSYHCRYFEMLAIKLSDYTEKCTISFLNLYKNTERNIRSLRLQKLTAEQQAEIVEQFAEIARKYGIYIDTCAEDSDFSCFGVCHACCIDKNRLERIGGFNLNIEKDKSQRIECGCVASIDIGAYNTCRNGCLYCYANSNRKVADVNFPRHDPMSPLLFGKITDEDVIKDRKMKSLIDRQLRLYE